MKRSEKRETSMSIEASRIPVITANQMREVDRLMVESYGVQIIQMMENAGTNLARLARRLLGGSVRGKLVTVAAGRGNNGGGGMAAARHLHNWGAQVIVLLENEEKLFGAPAAQWKALKSIQLRKENGDEAVSTLAHGGSDLVIEALIGYGLKNNPRGWTARMIEEINKGEGPIVALDIPAGLDATTGEIYASCVRATATVTLALPKTGLIGSGAEAVVGSLYLADIGVPTELYQSISIDTPPLFELDTLIRLEA